MSGDGKAPMCGWPHDVQRYLDVLVEADADIAGRDVAYGTLRAAFYHDRAFRMAIDIHLANTFKPDDT